MTEERLQFAAESRLRGAGLYKAERGRPYLYMNVHVVGISFNISLRYNFRRYSCFSNSQKSSTRTSARRSLSDVMRLGLAQGLALNAGVADRIDALDT